MITGTAAVVILLGLAAQARSVDLTEAISNPGQWQIVTSGAGGRVGTSPKLESDEPVVVRLTDCMIKGGELYFTVDLENDQDREIAVPIAADARLLDRRGVVEYRELLIQLGTATASHGFQSDQRARSTSLFGYQTVAGTTQILRPKERLSLRLKTEWRSTSQDLVGLRVHITGFDVTLNPTSGGYDKQSTWILPLFATSGPIEDPR